MNCVFAFRILTVVACLAALPSDSAQAKLHPIDRAYIDRITELDPIAGASLRSRLEEVDARNLEGGAEEDAIFDAYEAELDRVDERIRESEGLGDFADPAQVAKLRRVTDTLNGALDELDDPDAAPPLAIQARMLRYSLEAPPKVEQGALPETSYSGFSCPMRFSWQPIEVGPNSEVGSAAATKEKVKETVGSALGSAVGGLGGGGGFGLGGNRGGGSGLPRAGGGAPGGGQDPRLGEDIVPDGAKTTLRDEESGGSLSVGAVYRDNALHFSSNILDAPFNADGTFQTIFLETPYGTRAAPVRYTLLTLYQDWKLTVSWTYDRWVNGEHVEHREGGWSENGRNILGTWAIPSGEQGLWNELGFGTAQKGAKGLLVEFPISLTYLQHYPVKITTHITTPNMDPVMTVPFEAYLQADVDGNVKTMDRGEALNSYLFSDKGWGLGLSADYDSWHDGWKSGFGGYGGAGAYRDLTPQVGIDLGTLRTPLPNGATGSTPPISTRDYGVQYTSPTFAGFTLGSSYSDEADDFGIDPGIALRYAGEFGAFRLASGAGIDYGAPATAGNVQSFADSVQMGALSWQRPNYSFDPGVEDRAWDLDSDGSFDLGFKADYGLRLGGYYTSPKYLQNFYDPTLSAELGKVTYSLGGHYLYYDDAGAPGGELAEPDDYVPPATFVKGMCLNF